jgi:hypothetical protein
MQDQLKSACCNYDEEQCSDVPADYCGGSWIAGSTCEQVGCFPPTPIPIRNENTTYPGRCCQASCHDMLPSECTESVYYYEYGLGCNNYPCEKKGICIKTGYCQQDVPESICFIIGGSYTFGGTCEAGVKGRCTLGDNCNIMSQLFCESLSGTWDPDPTCPTTYGGCCNYRLGECENEFITNCDIANGIFYPNKDCSDIKCTPGSCCIHDFCIPNFNKAYCESLPASSTTFQPFECSYTGACNDIILFTGVEESITFPVSVTNVAIEASGSIINFTSAAIMSSNFTFFDSSVYFKEFHLNSSHLNVNVNSKLIVEGCLNFIDSKMIVDVTSNEYEKIKNGTSYELAQYSCNTGTIDVVAYVDGVRQDCIIPLQQPSLLQIFFDVKCKTTSEETDSSQSTTVSDASLTISSLFLLTMFLLKN